MQAGPSYLQIAIYQNCRRPQGPTKTASNDVLLYSPPARLNKKLRTLIFPLVCRPQGSTKTENRDFSKCSPSAGPYKNCKQWFCRNDLFIVFWPRGPDLFYHFFWLRGPDLFHFFLSHVLFYFHLASWPRLVLFFLGLDRFRFLGVSSGSSGSFIFQLFYQPPGLENYRRKLSCQKTNCVSP